jgi:hypothetical protein
VPIGDRTTKANKRIIQVFALLLALFAVMLVFFQFHVVGDSARDGVLLWNSEEAYLFFGWGRSGYHFTGFEYLFSYIPAYFGVNRTVDDNRLSMLVFRVTPTGVERYVTEPYQMYRGFLAYIPRGETIYAYDGGGVWKWAGTHFETVLLSEQQRIGLDENMFSSKEDYTNVNGWSSRHSMPGWPPKFEIALHGKPVAFFVTSDDLGKEVSVALQLPGQAPKHILHTRSELHLVSNSEYERIFSRVE